MLGRPILIHNFDGEVRAFLNVCSHRFSLLQCAPRGNRPVRCPYHGWAYDRDGIPVGIPGNAAHFGLDRTDRAALALPRYSLECRGRFLFVRLSQDGPALSDYLGPYAEILDHLSSLCSETFEDRSLPWASNWKLGVENVLEVYHAEFVHPDSFRQFVAKGWECSHARDHSRGLAPLSEASRRWWSGVTTRLGLNTDHRFTGYDHYFIFPNLAIGVTDGAMISVQTYEPVSAAECRLHFRLRLADAARTSAAHAAVTEQIRSFNLTVLDEDRQICERVHQGSRYVSRPPLLGRNEVRISAFHDAYRRYMDML